MNFRINLINATSMFIKPQQVDSAADLPWRAVVNLLRWPVQVKAKQQAGGWTPALLKDKAVEGNSDAAVSLAVLDIERGHLGNPPAMSEVVQLLKQNNWLSIVHTSFSHRPKAPRYRIVVAISRPLEGDERKGVLLGIADRLGLLDCVDVKAASNGNRLYFLPATTPETSTYFSAAAVNGELLDPKTIEVHELPTELTTKMPQGSPDGLIGWFNETTNIATLLEERGYKRVGRASWLSPNSKSGIAGVKLLPKKDSL